jgi:anthranilate phosphoribosyltransferase
MIEKMVSTLGRLGSTRVLAFHGHQGLDELATSGSSEVVELRDGELHRWTIDPAELGLERAGLEEVSGGTADENAAHIRGVLTGQGGPRRDIVLLNAAAGLVAAGLAEDMAGGLEKAARAVDSGDANGVLERLVETSRALR